MKKSEIIYTVQLSIFFTAILGGLIMPPVWWEWMYANQTGLLILIGIPAVGLGIWSTAVADRLHREGK